MSKRETDVTVRDVYGNALVVGDLIVYPARKGSWMAMNEARIEAIRTWEEEWPNYQWNAEQKRYIVNGNKITKHAEITVMRTATSGIGGMEAVQRRTVKLYNINNVISFGKCEPTETD